MADDSLSAPLAQRVERMREANTAAAQPVQGAEEAAAAQWGAMSERQRIATVAKAGQVVLPAQTWDSIPKQARAAIAAVMPAQTTAPAGMTQIPGMPNEWAASIEQGPNKVHQFNLRRFGGGVTGNPVKWRLTRSTRFPGTGITGAPTVEVGTFDSESEALAALAAEKARIAPPEQAPAAAPPESAAQPSQGARDGQEQRLQGRREEEVAGPPQLAGMADEERKAGGDPAVWSGRSAMQAGFARKAPSELSPDAAARWLAGWDAAKAETSETRPAAPVAESQAPAPSEPGDGEVATTQDSGAPSSPTPRELARLRKLLASLTELRACVAA